MPRETVVVGDALIDELDHPDGSSEHPGGAALNVAVGLARLGVSTSLIAMVGDDADGDVIRGYLQRHDVELIPTVGERGSARAVSYRVNGEPRYTFNAAAVARHIDVTAETGAALTAARHVVISCFPFDRPGQTEAILDAIPEAPKRLIVDANPRTGMMTSLPAFVAGFERAASVARLVKIGDEDAALLYSDSADSVAAHLKRIGARAVLTTAGRDGATLHLRDGPLITAPSTPMDSPVVDTMGAGDATTAAMTAAIIAADTRGRRVDWDQALRSAMDIAAATCRSAGALLQTPAAHGG